MFSCKVCKHFYQDKNGKITCKANNKFLRPADDSDQVDFKETPVHKFVEFDDAKYLDKEVNGIPLSEINARTCGDYDRERSSY